MTIHAPWLQRYGLSTKNQQVFHTTVVIVLLLETGEM